jgi:hypothetical protein
LFLAVAIEIYDEMGGTVEGGPPPAGSEDGGGNRDRSYLPYYRYTKKIGNFY